MNLQKNLKKLLFQKNLKAAELARLSGVSKTSIGEWLAGSNPRDIRKVKKVADALHVSVDELCFGDAENRNSPLKKYEEEIFAGNFDVILRKAKSN